MIRCTLLSIKRQTGIVIFGLACLFASASSHADPQSDLFRAAENDRPSVVQELMQKGLSPNVVEETRGENALIIAMREGSMKAFEVLLNTPGIDVNKRADNGDSALMMAAYKSNLPAVKMLLAKGAQPNQSGWTALHYAATSGNNEIVELLLSKGADINALAPNKTTPLMMAAWGGHIYTVKLLTDKGADIFLKNELDMTVVDFAKYNNHTDIAKGMQSRMDKLAAAKSKNQ